jgi:3',5'-cyclic AMP phosphodiesterase CpdA
MNEMTIALISDIHGNSWALDAVLEDINQRGIDQIVNLGDCVYGPLDPAGTCACQGNSGPLDVLIPGHLIQTNLVEQRGAVRTRSRCAVGGLCST